MEPDQIGAPEAVDVQTIAQPVVTPLTRAAIFLVGNDQSGTW